MRLNIVGVVVEKTRDNLVFVKEVENDRQIVVEDVAAAAYQSGDLLTLDLATKQFVDAGENYPFI
ncbi:hypothetical protein ACFC3Z_12120 [Enterococcus thailandicus]|uniref:hypothetical protein n=1 Tax=Enterococcus thailandicus TaxID=417368 RepID=UPI0035DBFBDC